MCRIKHLKGICRPSDTDWNRCLTVAMAARTTGSAGEMIHFVLFGEI